MRLLRILIGLCLLLPCVGVAAQAAIHRCVGANGDPVFTDGTCSDMQATATQPVARQPDDGRQSDGLAAFGAPPPIVCAANFAQLTQAVTDAFAIGDANRLAGLMLWSGEGHAAAVTDIRALHALMQHPLVDIGPPSSAEPASGDSSNVTAAPDDSSELVVRTAAGDGSGLPHETRFPVVRQAGCLWLRQP
jgi:hypothetical protein